MHELQTRMSLIACYGEKKGPLLGLITDLQAQIASMLGDGFLPYDKAQVHATIVGLESVLSGGQLLNRNFLELRGERRPADLDHLRKFLADTDLLPMRIRIGGYQQDAQVAFKSGGKHPYFRSFSIVGDSVVLIGWPVADVGYPRSLENLRRSLERYGVLHKYHGRVTDEDNDFYLVLGRIDPQLCNRQALASAETVIRQSLAAGEPVDTEIRRADLLIVQYEDMALPVESTRRVEFSEL